MKTLQLSVSDELHRKLKEAAWQARKGLADYTRSVLEEHVEKAETEPVAEEKQ